MRILLVRHGQSEGNVDEVAYTQKGDEGVQLTELGWRQAIGAGRFLKSQYQDEQEWPLLYFSPYTRTRETLAGVLHGLGNTIPGRPVLRGDSRLIEKSFGAVNILNHRPEDIDEHFAEQFKRVSDAAYEVDPFTTPNPLGESSKDNLISVKTFIDGTLDREIRRGRQDFLFIVHGAVIRNFLLSWAHLPPQARQDIIAPGNGDVISIEGERKNWSYRKIYDGQTCEEVDIDPLNGQKPLTIDDLPSVPEHLDSLGDDLEL